MPSLVIAAVFLTSTACGLRPQLPTSSEYAIRRHQHFVHDLAFFVSKLPSVYVFLFFLCRSICRSSKTVEVVPLKSCGLLCRSDQACASQPLLRGGACNGVQWGVPASATGGSEAAIFVVAPAAPEQRCFTPRRPCTQLRLRPPPLCTAAASCPRPICWFQRLLPWCGASTRSSGVRGGLVVARGW